MLFVGIGAAVLAVLVWAGRQARPLRTELRLGSALISALAAAGAVVAGLRGGWIVALGLLALSAFLGQTAARRPVGDGGSSTQAMGLGEARSVLGVRPDAGRAEIETAYRRLMLRAHPDHGGSTGLAAQLNAARERLVKG